MSTREFRFVEGSSDKFWRITLDGSSHTVQYGRSGTQGQTQTKSFDDELKAAHSYHKLIDEKLRKGYVEVDAADSPAATPTLAPPQPAAQSRRPQAAAEAVSPSRATTPPAARVDAPSTAVPEVEWPPRRALKLDPVDWLWATWRPRTTLTRPAPAPFDQTAAAARLARVPTEMHGYYWCFDQLEIPPTLARDEAQFWFLAITNDRYRTKPRDLAGQLRDLSLDGMVDRDVARRRISGRWLAPEVTLALANLFALPELISIILDYRELASSREGAAATPALIAGFRRYVLPYLTPDELAAVQDQLRRVWPSLQWPANLNDTPASAYFLAACVGLHQELQTLVSSLPEGTYGHSINWNDDHYHRPQDLVFGLGDPGAVEQQLRRLRLTLREPDHLRAWLAHTEYAALDVLRDSVLAAGSKETAVELLAAFALVEAPEAAPHMLQLMLESKAPQLARAWLEQHPSHAVAGLVPVAAGRGRLADAAVDLLRRFERRGHGDLIRRALDEAGEDSSRVRGLLADSIALEPMDDATTPLWLAEVLQRVSAPKRAVSWVEPADLPSIGVGQHALNDEQIAAVLAALQQSTLEQPDPLLAALKTHADARTLDAFVWQLFQLWIGDGAPTKDSWALRAVGLLGGDASVLKLTPLIRAWPGESQHQRAVAGLDVLRAVGSDTALMQINGIAQKVKFKALQAKAREAMEQIAHARGLTIEQLADRIVPDCDLDSAGSRVFDFGARSFTFALGPDLKPLLRDGAGKLRSDLPKPGVSDNPTMAQQAIDEWKLLKKQVAEVAKVQVVRLEAAMVTGRRWSAEEFMTLLVEHPLLTHLVQRLVWGVYEQGALVAGFRITEDRTPADSADEAYSLDQGATVGIVHPLQLDAAQLNAWGELLGDYEIVQPFAQLGRPTYALTADEQAASEITRFETIAIPVKAVLFTLDKLGWLRGIPEDNGVFYQHSRQFEGANVTAVVEYDGIAVGYYDDWEDQKLERCFFVPGLAEPRSYPQHTTRIPLAEIDPVVVSEVLHDLSLVAAKGS